MEGGIRERIGSLRIFKWHRKNDEENEDDGARAVLGNIGPARGGMSLYRDHIVQFRYRKLSAFKIDHKLSR